MSIAHFGSLKFICSKGMFVAKKYHSGFLRYANEEIWNGLCSKLIEIISFGRQRTLIDIGLIRKGVCKTWKISYNRQAKRK